MIRIKKGKENSFRYNFTVLPLCIYNLP